MRWLPINDHSLDHSLFNTISRWVAAAGNVKLLQTLLAQGQGWARGYAAAALVECIKVISDGTTGSSASSSGVTDSPKDVAAILAPIFEVLIEDKVPMRLSPTMLLWL